LQCHANARFDALPAVLTSDDVLDLESEKWDRDLWNSAVFASVACPNTNGLTKVGGYWNHDGSFSGGGGIAGDFYHRLRLQHRDYLCGSNQRLIFRSFILSQQSLRVTVGQFLNSLLSCIVRPQTQQLSRRIRIQRLTDGIQPPIQISCNRVHW
jgi:hypothetical protein